MCSIRLEVVASSESSSPLSTACSLSKDGYTGDAWWTMSPRVRKRLLDRSPAAITGQATSEETAKERHTKPVSVW